MCSERRLEAITREGKTVLAKSDVTIDFNSLDNGASFQDFCTKAFETTQAYAVEIMYRHKLKPIWVVTDRIYLRRLT